jgi:hypothetical protein
MRLLVNCWDVVGESVCVEVLQLGDGDERANATPQVLLRRWLRCPHQWLSGSTQARVAALADLLQKCGEDMPSKAGEGRTPGRVAEE